MTRKKLMAEIGRLKSQLDEIEAVQPQTPEVAAVIRKLQKLEPKSKDWWDRLQTIGALLLPIIIAIVGWLVSKNITSTQLKASRQIAQSQLTKDYVSILAEAMSKKDDDEILTILDSLAALKEVENGLPPAIQGILGRIKRSSRSPGVLRAASMLTSSEIESKLRSYYGDDK